MNGTYENGRWYCDCGRELRWLTSRQPHSRGRRFMSCPISGAARCGFFLWEEDEMDNRVPRSTAANNNTPFSSQRQQQQVSPPATPRSPRISVRPALPTPPHSQDQDNKHGIVIKRETQLDTTPTRAGTSATLFHDLASSSVPVPSSSAPLPMRTTTTTTSSATTTTNYNGYNAALPLMEEVLATLRSGNVRLASFTEIELERILETRARDYATRLEAYSRANKRLEDRVRQLEAAQLGGVGAAAATAAAS